MRYLFICWCLFPLAGKAQQPTSSCTLAGEITRQWLTDKLFHGDANAYEANPVTEVKPFPGKSSSIYYTATRVVYSKGLTPDFRTLRDGSGTRIRYAFTFYLDNRMRVVAAESARLGDL